MLVLRARTGLLATVVALAVSASPAWGADPFKQRMTELTKTVDAIDGQARTLDASIAPGRGILSREMATLRYQDAVYDYMLGEYEKAGETFFSLVASGVLTDAGLHADSEWYLAESLYRMGNASTAEGHFRAIAAVPGHIYREDAVRRLLELYAELGNADMFYEVYSKEISSGKVAPSPLVSYTVAKAFYTQSEFDKAAQQFERVPVESEWYARSRYFLGTIQVAQGEFEAALPFFAEVGETSPQSLEDRQVYDLAFLAMGRLNYELGQYEEASSAYSRVVGDSEFLADKLYEQVWVHVKQERWAEALRSVEVFLLGFPEHEYTARLKLLEGHLHLQQEQYEPALVSYEDVISDYTPVRDRFADLASTLDDPERYFQRVLDISRGEMSADSALPAYAVAMMLADDNLKRSLEVYEDLIAQVDVVEDSEGLIEEISEALTRSDAVGGFGEVGYQASSNQLRALQTFLEVIEAEEGWLLKTSTDRRTSEAFGPLIVQRDSITERLLRRNSEDESGTAPAAPSSADRRRMALTSEVDELRERAETLIERSTSGSLSPEAQSEAALELEEVEATLAEKGEELAAAGGPLRGAESGSGGRASGGAWAVEMGREITELRKQYATHRPDGDSGPDALTMARFDGMYTTLEHDIELYDEILRRVATAQSDEMTKIRERFDAEVRQVSEQRGEIQSTKKDVEGVALALTRDGFGRLEGFFSEALLGADVGIVDVFWAEKLQTSDRRERLAEERNELIEELESRFSLIRSKLGEERN